MTSTVQLNLVEIEEKIAAACGKAGRRRDELTLVAVSKTFPASAVDEAVAAGITDIGENRVQELRDKFPLISSRPRIHLIGHLQSNKAKEAARLCHVIQTVDSTELAHKLDRAAAGEGKQLDVMIQVNVGGEAQKSGIEAGELHGLAASLLRCTSLRLIGLMTVPPAVTGDAVRPYFRQLRALRDELCADERFAAARQLSMGMSDDFEVAIEEGSTMIRLGRAIFGARG